MKTPEELWKDILNYSQGGAKLGQAKDMFDKFFEDNAIIPQGPKRHNDAVAICAYIMNPELTLQINQFGKWDTAEAVGIYYDLEYRIKPEEPEVEYQWFFMRNGEAKILDGYGKTLFLTLEEAEKYTHTLTKIDATKRVRQ